VDLWFKSLTHPGIGKALQKVDAVYVPPTGLNPPLFAGDGVVFWSYARASILKGF
jgi:hypothetical protein